MDWTWIYSSGPEHVCFQACPNKKAAWLIEAKRVFPIGIEVLVKDCSPHAPSPGVDAYLGHRGRVVGYDTGSDGEWPLVSVEFSPPLPARDGFYDDEIAKVKGGA
jgi:hypothetical protein